MPRPLTTLLAGALDVQTTKPPAEQQQQQQQPAGEITTPCASKRSSTLSRTVSFIVSHLLPIRVTSEDCYSK